MAGREMRKIPKRIRSEYCPPPPASPPPEKSCFVGPLFFVVPPRAPVALQRIVWKNV